MQNDRHYNKEDLQPPRASEAPRAADAPVASEAERAGDAPPASDAPAAHGKRSVLRRVWNVFTTVLVAIVVLFALLLVGVRLFGIQVYSIISGSMEPGYPVGSLFYVKPAEASEIRVGDVITFVLPNETPATHRVVEIDAENERFWTKGDSNEERDGAPVYFQNLIGRPVFTIPYLGYIAHYIQNPPGMYIALACGALLLVLVFVPDLLKRADKSAGKRESEQHQG